MTTAASVNHSGYINGQESRYDPQMLPRCQDHIDCEFCGDRMCEFFAEIDASNLIRASVVAHFSRCTSWPRTFSDEVFLIYCALLVEAHRRKRVLRRADHARLQAAAISGEWPC